MKSLMNLKRSRLGARTGYTGERTRPRAESGIKESCPGWRGGMTGLLYLPETGLDEWALAAHDAVYTDLASKYGDPREKEEVLCEAEMHGGRTTLINFTRNVFKALFFAALDLNDGDADNDGRVVIFDAKQRLEPGANVFNPDRALRLLRGRGKG